MYINIDKKVISYHLYEIDAIIIYVYMIKIFAYVFVW